jgi:hypothetical protein
MDVGEERRADVEEQEAGLVETSSERCGKERRQPQKRPNIDDCG